MICGESSSVEDGEQRQLHAVGRTYTHVAVIPRRDDRATDLLGAGRDNSNRIKLHDTEASRRHAEFVRTNTGFAVRDVGSLNGTYVNRERIDQAALAGGDEVQIGKYRLVFYPSQHASAGTGGAG
jgi:pSer/pThr/pTyr-binding forkhead associated (FHA) protein